ncbi:MAG: hypothetical protein HRU25_15370, partial [Psychrobium sp.]|nr:hypothetical protein [Psychrobium sp.]
MNPLNHLFKRIKTLIALAMLGLLVSCSSDGPADETEIPETPPTATAVIVPVPIVVPKTLTDLTINAHNELLNVAELHIEVQINANRSFLSICSNLPKVLDLNRIDYEKCMLRAPLDKSLKTFSLTLPNHIHELVAIVWFYDTNKAP